MDKRYVKLLSKGNVEAFDWLFLRYQPKVVTFINSFLKDAVLSEDMAQDIFLQVWENRDGFLEVECFQSFLFKMAKNKLCNYFDHLHVKEKYKSSQLAENYRCDDSPEELMLASELDLIINQALEGLTSQQKKIFQMSRFDGFTNTEISQQLGISKRTVENHLTTALAYLRQSTKERNITRSLFTLFI